MTRRGRHGQPLQGTGVRLHRWHYRAVGVVFIGVAISGLLWSMLYDALGREPDDLSRTLMRWHGAFAMLTLIALGALLPQHVRFAWHAARNRWSGVTLLVIAATLGVTGYGLYYADESMRDWSKWIHLGIGVIATAAMPLHIWLGRRRACATSSHTARDHTPSAKPASAQMAARTSAELKKLNARAHPEPRSTV